MKNWRKKFCAKKKSETPNCGKQTIEFNIFCANFNAREFFLFSFPGKGGSHPHIHKLSLYVSLSLPLSSNLQRVGNPQFFVLSILHISPLVTLLFAALWLFANKLIFQRTYKFSISAICAPFSYSIYTHTQPQQQRTHISTSACQLAHTHSDAHVTLIHSHARTYTVFSSILR